jgi:bacterioferritin-associated ferredoxin
LSEEHKDSLMYVCICNAIRETELRCAARRVRGNAEAIYGSLGRTPQCRQCLDEAEDIIADEVSSAGMGIAAAA